MNYRYYIGYYYTTTTGLAGMGREILDLNHPLDTIEEIQEIENKIQKQSDLINRVTILNWKIINS